MKVMSEGYPFIFGGFAVSVLLTILYRTFDVFPLLIAALAALLFALASCAFFRSPKRKIPEDDRMLVSPADGKVMRILEVDDEYVGPAFRVDIFLSVFDVHVNRIPASGIVDFVAYRQGRFVSAFKDKASEQNERNDIGISGTWGKLRVAQIAGSVARRIACHVREREQVAAGQVCGMIRFGSRTEITFPRQYVPTVQPGQRVKGGETVVGRLNDHA